MMRRNVLLCGVCFITVGLMAQVIPRSNLPSGAHVVLDLQGDTITGGAPDCYSAQFVNTCDGDVSCPWADGPSDEEPPTEYGSVLHFNLCHAGGPNCGTIASWRNCP